MIRRIVLRNKFTRRVLPLIRSLCCAEVPSEYAARYRESL